VVFTIASKGFRLIIPAVSSLFGYVPLIGATVLYFGIGWVNEGYLFKKTQKMVSTADSLVVFTLLGLTDSAPRQCMQKVEKMQKKGRTFKVSL
jgi:hypothetical protein